MSDQDPAADPNTINSLPELMAHALAIEVEAEITYAMLADQMETHNNPDLAQIFRKLADIEGRHAAELRQRTADMALPRLKPWQYKWQEADSPEALDISAAHYLMTPWHALRLALEAERRAHRFFDKLAKSATDPEIQAMAAEFAEEEAGHVALVEDLLAKQTEPDENWADDFDPAQLQE
jgi:rubrerythrin